MSRSVTGPREREEMMKRTGELRYTEPNAAFFFCFLQFEKVATWARVAWNISLCFGSPRTRRIVGAPLDDVSKMAHKAMRGLKKLLEKQGVVRLPIYEVQGSLEKQK